ncbi:MAG: DNA topoisomerase IV subunit A [Lentisphaeria bacterium]|nr:DNA topoisomerase IV subunit A [Lentisphaeria bacterium]
MPKDETPDLFDIAADEYEAEIVEVLEGGDDEPPEDNNLDAAPPEEEDSALKRMMSGYYMEYASYVIKERAIPDLRDGLKPVQRRILHSLFEMNDGKLHKVANVVGNTMKYHPHGDSSIYGALVHIANKDYFIDRQGNFGNIYTGDNASAARYIECRLSNLALEVLFNRELTEFTETYDSRNKEPVALVSKIPSLLLQGSEGIAVGMSTKILSHNFNELMEAQIAILRNQEYEIYPDFIHECSMDVSEYKKGNGKVRLRARIETPNEKTLVINAIPQGITTETLIKSIEEAVNKGKVKISNINDYTAENVEIEIRLPRGVYADATIKALYAYTQCELSISCNCLVIDEGHPRIMDVHEILKENTYQLKDTLRRELELQLHKLEDMYHLKSLVQLFIENRVYKRIEECESIEEVRSEVRLGLKPYLNKLIPPTEAKAALERGEKPKPREITDEDIEKLLQIPIRRISKFDIQKNQDELQAILDETEQVLKYLAQLTKYTIRYIKELIKKYGDLYPRRTQIEELKQIDVRKVAISNLNVGHDKKQGFIGTSVKSEEPINCNEYDRLVIIKRDGTLQVLPIQPKTYVGPILALFKANKDHIYSLIYRDRKSQACYVKRFQVNSYIMEKEYKIIPAGCKIEKLFDKYGVVLRCEFIPKPRMKEKFVDLEFDQIEVRKTTARGFKVHNNVIDKFIQIKRGFDPSNMLAEQAEEDE